MTTHIWKPLASGFILDPTNYTDGTAFQPGDTLIVHDGQVGAVATELSYLTAGTYDFDITSSTAQLVFGNVELTADTSFQVTGTLTEADFEDQFVNLGSFVIGSATTSGDFHTFLIPNDDSQASFTNGGSMLVQTASTLTLEPGYNPTAFTNEAGASIVVDGASSFVFGNYYGPQSDLTFTNNGVITVSGAGSSIVIESDYFGTSTGTFAVAGTPGGSGTIAELQGGATGSFTIASGTLNFSSPGNAGALPITASVTFLDNAGVLEVDDDAQTFSGVIHGFSAGDEIILSTATGIGSDEYDQATHTLDLYLEPGDRLLADQLTIDGTYTTADFTVSTEFGPTIITVTCFLEGTLIRTDRGEVAVETLLARHRSGLSDRVATLVDGEIVHQPVAWVGTGTVADAAASDAWPVRIRAHAFADNIPARDLLVTPDHCLFVNGRLIPARMLVNGRSIRVDRTIDAYAFFHVELDRHAILLSEGLATESYLDTGNRAGFDAGDVASIATRSWDTDAAAPLAVDQATVQPVWEVLDRRAALLGLGTRPEDVAMTNDADPRLLLSCGQVVRPWDTHGDRISFRLAPGQQPARLLSRAARPCDIVGPFLDDRRRLGMAVSKLVLWQGLESVVVAADALTLSGWHGLEIDRRWSNGSAELQLPPTDATGAVLDIHVAATLSYPYQREPFRSAA